MDATSSVQTQLDAKAPISQPEFTSYVDFDSITAPSAPSDSGDVRVYANNSKLYFHGQGGSATEIGAGGGGVGSIDTLFTIQAKSADAAYTAIGNGYVWSGAGSSLTNATLALETTDLDLIQSEKVFAYDSGGSGIRNWWYHEQEIQNGYGGKNMVLQLQYFTRNCADSNIFRFYARDAAKPIFTSDGSADAGTNQILGAASWDASLSTSSPDDRKAAAVGDRIVIIDTSNNIHYRYITAVSGAVVTPGALTITYSGSDIAPANSTVMLIGVMTDELDYLPANNMSAAGNNEAKLYKKQMAFPEGCRLFQFGFHVESTDVDVELYYDDIALSANQFLQTSSLGMTECYFAKEQNNFWDASGSGEKDWDQDLLVPEYGTPALANSKLLDIKTVGSQTNIEAKVPLTLTWNIGAPMTADGYISIKNQDDDVFGYQQNGGGSANQNVFLSSTVNLAKGEYLYADCISPHSRYGYTNITATPLVNDVILLNSASDEIFTDWQDGGAIVVGGTSGAPTKPSGILVDKMYYRRSGANYQFRVEYCQTNTTSAASGSSTDYLVTLPAGLSFDLAKVSTYTTAEGYGVWNTGGVGLGSASGSWSDQSATGFIVPYSATQFRVYLSRHGDDGVWGSAMFPLAGYANLAITCDFEAPIAGCTSTFNPVLSMPLVDFSSWENTFVGKIDGSSSGASIVANTQSPYNWVESVTRNSIGNYTITYPGLGLTYPPNFNAITDNRVHTHISVTSVTATQCTFVSYDPFFDVYRDDDFMFQLTKVASDYVSPPQATAAVIKPSVCILKWITGETTNAGSSSVGLNTHKITNAFGETWFVTGAWSSTNTDFTLEPGQYLMEAYGPAMRSNYHHLRLYNTSDSTYDCEGSAEYNGSGDTVQTHSMIKHAFTITSSKTYQFKTYVAAAQSGDGLGVQASSNGESVHLQCVIHKLK